VKTTGPEEVPIKNGYIVCFLIIFPDFGVNG